MVAEAEHAETDTVNRDVRTLRFHRIGQGGSMLMVSAFSGEQIVNATA